MRTLLACMMLLAAIPVAQADDDDGSAAPVRCSVITMPNNPCR